jgi:hypothetical protein
MTQQPPNHNWPKVFSGRGEVHVNLEWMRTAGLERYYVEGYKLAGDILLERVKADPSLLFPLGFAYRQYIENELKYLIDCMKFLGVKAVANQTTNIHALKKLWALTRDGLESKWGKDTTGELEGAESVIFDFHNADPTGQEMRYPTFSPKAIKPKTTKISLESLPGALSVSGMGDAINMLYKTLSQCAHALENEIVASAKRDIDEVIE